MGDTTVLKKLVTILLTEPVYYLLPDDCSPAFYRVDDEFMLANPLLHDARIDFERWCFSAPSGELCFSSTVMIFLVAQSLGPSHKYPELFDRPLARFKAAARQATIGRMCGCIEYPNTNVLSKAKFHDSQDRKQLNGDPQIERSSWYTTAVTRTHLERLSDGSFVDYVHESFILDAFAAYAVENFRSCLIYVAFAAEAAAGRWLADQHRAAMAARPPYLRVRESQGNSQAPILQKDDVWNHLAKGNADACLLLFHLRPLYLVKRSIMLEDQRLYAKLTRLFTTRNSIVHSDSKSNAYSHVRESADEVLETMFALLRWCGLPSDFELPSTKFMETLRDPRRVVTSGSM